MPKRPTRARLIPICLALCALASSPQLAAGQGAESQAATRGGRGPQTQAPAPTGAGIDQDAERTREQFMELLNRLPPSTGRVLKLDPALLNNQAYLAAYPSVVTFLTQHPEVARNPAYFLAPVQVQTDGYYYAQPRSSASRMVEEVLAGIAVFAGFTTAFLMLGWLVRTLLDYRRWHRLHKVQAEAHTKLLDRFSANEELIAYVQSPAGRQFLESAPISLDPGSRRLGAPFGRILWSVQAGLVLAMGGLGLQWVSGRVVDPDTTEALYAMGVLGLMLGAGFILSAVVAYVLSKRLGLFDGATSKNSELRT